MSEPGKQVAPQTKQLRLPYPTVLGKELDFSIRQWQVFVEAIWPAAKSVDAVCMALSYCKARNLDPMKKPVHIVPVYSTELKKYLETVWPSIAELRTTAMRTNAYAGKDDTRFGPTIQKDFKYKDETAPLEFPEWAQITVYRMVQGVRCPFVGPRVLWLEAYATKSHDSEIPNTMWRERSVGQLDKCAEAAALRAAFPEELGNDHAAEEMEGRIMHDISPMAVMHDTDKVTPPRPTRSEFERKDTPQTAKDKTPPAEPKKVEPEKKQPDPEPEQSEQPDESVHQSDWDIQKAQWASELTMIKRLRDVPPFRDTIANQLEGEELTWWNALCEAQTEEIAKRLKAPAAA